MVRRRFAPLIAVVVAGAALFLLRLFQFQVVEREIWAGEAAGLLRSGRVLSYRRGRILDTKGRVLVREEDVYDVEFCYRDFRRGHPLGQVTHARSALEMRAVSLQEGRAHLSQWAFELARVTPGELDGFARGGPLSLPSLAIPPAEREELDLRAERASDLRFYIGALLGFERRDWLALRRVSQAGIGSSSFLDLAAEWRQGGDVERVRWDLEARLEDSLADLELFAGMLLPDTTEPSAELILDLESWRRSVENAAADRLFREAAGFSAGRISPGTLAANVDLQWLAGHLCWEPERVEEWLRAARERWLSWRDAWAIQAMAAELGSQASAGASDARLVDLALSSAAGLFAAEQNIRDPKPAAGVGWQNLGELAVVSQLHDLLETRRVHAGDARPWTAFEDPALRAYAVESETDCWQILGLAETWNAPGSVATGGAANGERVREIARAWRTELRGGARRSKVAALLRSLVGALDERFQERLALELNALRESAEIDAALESSRPLRVAEGRLDRAAERARFLVKDLSSRPIQVERGPEYDLVHLLARYPERFAGFTVQDARVRVTAPAREGGAAVAPALVGEVRRADVVRLHRQRVQEAEMRRLQGKGERTPEEDRLLSELVREVVLPGEALGGSGIEGYFDAELRGRNGYEERRGVETEGGPRSVDWYLAPVDGKDLVLTLDSDLQCAAEQALEHPRGDPDPAERDEVWLANPVGALVLLSAQGDVLAAASVPRVLPAARERFETSASRRERERGLLRERTLQIPDFQPLGSVFKPFAAVWALDRLGWDARVRSGCHLLADGRAGYLDVHCWREFGHGDVDLREALQGSCNAYFARLGEAFAGEELSKMAEEFGFGGPTGIRAFGERSGLREDDAERLRSLRPSPREKRLAANGLGVIEGTPMQVARAFAGLATGALPTVRIVRQIGGEEVAPEKRALRISIARLEFVRRALFTVVNEPGGTAFARELDAPTLGFALAAKTGSGDITTAGQDGKVRKHAWMAGWFPAEAPRAIIVVFVYDTTKTASHSAVWIAQQFLTAPAVRAFLGLERS